MEKEQALMNRMVVISFFNPVEADDEIQHFFKKLLKEQPYIVRHALDALRDLAKRNHQVAHVPVPEEYIPEEGRYGLQSVQSFHDFLVKQYKHSNPMFSRSKGHVEEKNEDIEA